MEGETYTGMVMHDISHEYITAKRKYAEIFIVHHVLRQPIPRMVKSNSEKDSARTKAYDEPVAFFFRHCAPLLTAFQYSYLYQKKKTIAVTYG